MTLLGIMGSGEILCFCEIYLTDHSIYHLASYFVCETLNNPQCVDLTSMTLNAQYQNTYILFNISRITSVKVWQTTCSGCVCSFSPAPMDCLHIGRPFKW